MTALAPDDAMPVDSWGFAEIASCYLSDATWAPEGQTPPAVVQALAGVGYALLAQHQQQAEMAFRARRRHWWWFR